MVVEEDGRMDYGGGGGLSKMVKRCGKVIE